MAKKGGSQTVTSQLDPQTQKWREQVWNAAQAEASNAQPGVNPLTRQAADLFSGGANLGLGGLAALGGDANAFATFSNPFTSQVIDAVRNDFGVARDATSTHINDQATRAGAFGGSRHGVAEGIAQGDLSRAETSQIAGLRQAGFEDAMSRAAQAANLGLGSADALQRLGEYERQVAIQSDPTTHRFRTLFQTLGGLPYGSTTTQPVNRNPLTGALGGAATGFSFGGPIGAAAGGLIGLLGL